MSDTIASPDILSAKIRAFCSSAHKGPVYLAEAEFGLQQIRPFLDELEPGARVLEVGSGPCIVLAALAEHYPDLQLKGIEPMGSGFALFEAFVSNLEAGISTFSLFKGGYETFPRTGDWDLIFLINVFEHLPDWRDFLRFIRDSLSPSGRCFVLCPNYGFPYESHFGLPILWNKVLTRFLFRRRIERFEQAHGWDGLYRSLNFVKLGHVRREMAQAGLELDVHTEIIQQMIDRLETDKEFAARQKSIAGLARLIRWSGMLNWLLARPAVQNRLPYMKLELRRVQ